MQTVEKFSTLYPEIDIITKYLPSPDIEETDIVISDKQLWKKELNREALLTEDILLAIHQSNPLSKKEVLTLDDLKSEPFICTNDDSSLYSITQNICKNMGFAPRVVIHSDDPYYIRKCIELGLGISFIPSVSWNGQFSEQIVLKKIGNYKRTTYVYKNSNKRPTETLNNFLDMLRHECEREVALSNTLEY